MRNDYDYTYKFPSDAPLVLRHILRGLGTLDYRVESITLDANNNLDLNVFESRVTVQEIGTNKVITDNSFRDKLIVSLGRVGVKPGDITLQEEAVQPKEHVISGNLESAMISHSDRRTHITFPLEKFVTLDTVRTARDEGIMNWLGKVEKTFPNAWPVGQKDLGTNKAGYMVVIPVGPRDEAIQLQDNIAPEGAWNFNHVQRMNNGGQYVVVAHTQALDAAARETVQKYGAAIETKVARDAHFTRIQKADDIAKAWRDEHLPADLNVTIYQGRVTYLADGKAEALQLQAQLTGSTYAPGGNLTKIDGVRVDKTTFSDAEFFYVYMNPLEMSAATQERVVAWGKDEVVRQKQSAASDQGNDLSDIRVVGMDVQFPPQGRARGSDSKPEKKS